MPARGGDGRGPVSVNGEIEVVFRLHVERPARATPPYIVGAHPKLGGLVPNRVRMYDDGTHGEIVRANGCYYKVSGTRKN